MKLGISLPCLNTPSDALADYAVAAESAGFDSVWSYEFYRSPYFVLGPVAQATSTISLGTAVGASLTRTPFTTANAAADVDELCGGRFTLGLGMGAPEFLDAFHGVEHDRPITRLREYIAAVRACWEFLGNDKPGSFSGEHYQVHYPECNPYGARPMVRPEIPIYLAAMRPKMTQLAGEIADGLIGYLFSPQFLQEVVNPNIAEGAARAGRSPSDVETLIFLVCCINDDREEAMRVARNQVGLYVAGSGIVDEVVKFHGLQEQQQKLREALLQRGPAALATETSDELVHAFSVTGTPDECRDQLAGFEGHASTILLHTPYVPPLTREDSHDAFYSILDTFGQGR